MTVTPTEADGTVYFPDSGGTLWAVAADTGQVRWSHRVSVYTGIAGDVSRTSPAVYGDELVLGDTSPAGTGASVIAVDRRTGKNLWHYQLGASMSSTAGTTYMLDGRQYLLVPAGSMLTAFALPQR